MPCVSIGYNRVAVVGLRARHLDVLRQLRSLCPTADSHGSCLHTYLVPHSRPDERAMGERSALHQQRLHTATIELVEYLRNNRPVEVEAREERPVAVYHDAQRVGS